MTWTFQDAPDSPKDEPSGPGSLVVPGLDGSGGHDKSEHRRPRHLLYTTHFPLPQVSNHQLFILKVHINTEYFLYQSLCCSLPNDTFFRMNLAVMTAINVMFCCMVLEEFVMKQGMSLKKWAKKYVNCLVRSLVLTLLKVTFGHFQQHNCTLWLIFN